MRIKTTRRMLMPPRRGRSYMRIGVETGPSLRIGPVILWWPGR